MPASGEVSARSSVWCWLKRQGNDNQLRDCDRHGYGHRPDERSDYEKARNAVEDPPEDDGPKDRLWNEGESGIKCSNRSSGCKHHRRPDRDARYRTSKLVNMVDMRSESDAQQAHDELNEHEGRSGDFGEDVGHAMSRGGGVGLSNRAGGGERVFETIEARELFEGEQNGDRGHDDVD